MTDFVRNDGIFLQRLVAVVWLASSFLGTSVAWGSCGDYVIVLGSHDSPSASSKPATMFAKWAMQHRQHETPSPICHGPNCKSRSPLPPMPTPTRQIHNGDQWAVVTNLNGINRGRANYWRIDRVTLTLDGHPLRIDRPPRS